MHRSSGSLVLCAVLSLTLKSMSSDVLTVAQADVERIASGRASVDISADGRYVAFTSLARLVPGDMNETRDIYVLDRMTGRVTLEVFEVGGNAGRHNDRPDLSADGRFLVYETHLSSRDDEPLNIVLRDRQAETARILSRAPSGGPANGASHAPSISGDGSVVAFTSAATNLVAGVGPNGMFEDVYIADLSSGTMRRISDTSATGSSVTGSSIAPAVSGNGRYVAFVSTARLDPEMTGELEQGVQRRIPEVYVHDVALRKTTRVSIGHRGARANGSSSWPAISEDGRHIAFVSAASNLVAHDDNDFPDVFVADWQARSVELVSRGVAGRPANDASDSPAISADGRFVAFQSEASNLACTGRCAEAIEDINLLWDVFLLDRKTRSMTHISRDPRRPWMEASVGPAVDATARVLAFSSRHPAHAADRHNDFDLFVVAR